ncbi:MAG: HNH endonuclease [Azospirillaceae bacterium]|nr:HNH endonuclease [Azospirillaceae bacterium]
MTRDDATVMDILQGGRCFYCDAPVGAKATFDHVIPQCYGGTDDPGNIVLAHRRCNQRKADRLPDSDTIDRLIAMRRGSRIAIWPPLLALRHAAPGQAEIAVARAVAALRDLAPSPVASSAPTAAPQPSAPQRGR